MTATSLDSEPLIAGAHAHGYERIGKVLTDVSVLSPSEGWAAGGIVSNAQDVARFYRALAQGKLVRPATVRGMQVKVPFPVFGTKIWGYGQGLFTRPLPCGPAFGHPGSIPGYLADAWNSPDGRHQAVLLLNLGEHSRSDAASGAIQHAVDTAFCG
jgi:D-alanyl-D-alanine carboxypeptidase